MNIRVATDNWHSGVQYYNDGGLVGDSYDATDAAEVTSSQPHRRQIRPETHEELWVMDHEHILVSGELGPRTATRWGEAYDELDNPELWPAVRAWVRSGSCVTEGNSDTPALGEFQIAFVDRGIPSRTTQAN